MLPRPEAPARRLPYTTADMSERLAKKKAEQDAAAQAQANQALRFGVTNPPAVKKDEPWYKDALGAVGGAIKSAYEWLPNEMPSTTPINMGGDAGVLMGSQGTPKSLVLEPARLAVRRAVGDITAIPRVGEPSPSYTADQIRDQGVALGVLGAAIDYSQFIPLVAKGAGFTGDAVNAYKLAMMERQANPFPALRGASNVIDVVPGSRLPARVVEPPTPATRLGESLAQRTLDARAAQVGVRDAGVIRFPSGEPTPKTLATMQKDLPDAENYMRSEKYSKIAERINSATKTIEDNYQIIQVETQQEMDDVRNIWEKSKKEVKSLKKEIIDSKDADEIRDFNITYKRFEQASKMIDKALDPYYLSPYNRSRADQSSVEHFVIHDKGQYGGVFGGVASARWAPQTETIYIDFIGSTPLLISGIGTALYGKILKWGRNIGAKKYVSGATPSSLSFWEEMGMTPSDKYKDVFEGTGLVPMVYEDSGIDMIDKLNN